MQPKRLVQAEHTHAVIPVKSGNSLKKLFHIFRSGQPAAQSLYLLADIAVVHQFRLSDGVVVRELRKAVDFKHLLQICKIIVKQLEKSLKVIFCKMVHAGAVRSADFLTRQAERIFIHHEHEGEIVLPQILVKAIIRRNNQNPLYLLINPRFLPDPVASPLQLPADVRQLHQYALLRHIAVHNQSR